MNFINNSLNQSMKKIGDNFLIKTTNGSLEVSYPNNSKKTCKT